MSDADAIEAGELFFGLAYSQDANLIYPDEATMVGDAALSLSAEQRHALAGWLARHAVGSEAHISFVLSEQLGCQSDAHRWVHPGGLPERGAAALVRYITRALLSADGRP